MDDKVKSFAVVFYTAGDPIPKAEEFYAFTAAQAIEATLDYHPDAVSLVAGEICEDEDAIDEEKLRAAIRRRNHDRV